MGGWGQRLWGYENDCNRHLTVACCLSGPWAGKKGEGKSGSFIPAFLSERETAFSSSLCNNWNKAGGSQVVLNGGQSWCFVVHHNYLWSRHTISPHWLHFGLFFLLAPRQPRVGAAYQPPAAALSSGRPCRVLHQRWVRETALHAACVQDAPPPSESGARAALLSEFPCLQWSWVLM